MAVADVLETRISTRAGKGQESQNYLKHDYCRHKKLSYRRGTARCIMSIEILPIATQQRRNYYEVGDLVGGNE